MWKWVLNTKETFFQQEIAKEDGKGNIGYWTIEIFITQNQTIEDRFFSTWNHYNNKLERKFEIVLHGFVTGYILMEILGNHFTTT